MLHLKWIKISAICFVLSLTACTSGTRLTTTGGPDSRITIMTFNVENLFDTQDDPGKNDATYLPLTSKTTDEHIAGCEQITVDRWREQCLHYDWNETALKAKMQALARAILQVDEGRGPDILVLQEVENWSVLERLRIDYLAAAGFRPAILIDGSDRRGIDVAFLSRLPVVGQPVLHPVRHSSTEQARIDDTRGILEATFRLPDNSLVTGFAVHFPAPFHPVQMREQAYTTLNRLHDALPQGRMAFAAGDFNTPADEDVEFKMLDRFVRPRWFAMHEFCSGCPGTHYYPPKGWSFLDMILWSKSGGENATWQMRENATRLVNGAAGQATGQGIPNRFEPPDGPGISDHWPLAISIELVSKQ